MADHRSRIPGLSESPRQTPGEDANGVFEALAEGLQLSLTEEVDEHGDRNDETGATGVGRAFDVFGMPTIINVTAQQTGGAYVAVETEAPLLAGPPPHVHEREDEAFFVLEGTFEILCGDRTVRLSVGQYAFGPRGVPHAFRNVGSGTGRILTIINPAGFERCLEELSKLPPGPPDLAAIGAICAKYGCRIHA